MRCILVGCGSQARGWYAGCAEHPDGESVALVDISGQARGAFAQATGAAQKGDDSLDEALDAGPAGYARSVLINGEAQMAAYDFRLAVGGAELKSTRFTVTELAGKFIFEGGGYGHGVGLCQWGACGLAKADRPAMRL